jgi:hypothetical protein
MIEMGEREEMEKRHAARIAELEAEAAELRADKARLDWLDTNPRAVVHAQGYCGALSGWVWRDREHAANDADSLRAAIDAAMERKA